MKIYKQLFPFNTRYGPNLCTRTECEIAGFSVQVHLVCEVDDLSAGEIESLEKALGKWANDMVPHVRTCIGAVGKASSV